MEKVHKIIVFAIVSLLSFGMISLSAQNRDKQITVNANNVTVKELLTLIEKESNYSFIYKDADIDPSKTMSLNGTGTVEQLVKKAFPNLDIRFENRMIVLTSKKAEVQPNPARKGIVTVTGTVTDLKGVPVAGAMVLVKGAAVGSAVDPNGKYSIKVDAGSVLVASLIGYADAEEPVNGRTVINFQMKEDVQVLDDVVVIGYGTQSKLTLTGSVAQTSGADLVKNSSVNLSQGLAGRLSGVIVNNRSGEPGADDATMFIRGRSTLGDNSPLIIIDGIPGRDEDFSRLTGDEIESVNVLKDASGAIYGSRSANGVILVTTKRGKYNEAPTVTFSYDLGLQQPTRLVEMADAVLFTQAYNDELAITGAAAKYNPTQLKHYKDGDDLILYPNTNWFDQIIKNYSAQHKYGVNIQGGAGKVAYFVQFNGQYQDGIYKQSATNYNQYNLRSNIDIQVTKSLKLGVSIDARQQHKNYSAFPSDDYGIFYITTRMKPTGAAYYPNGYLRGGTNPAILVQDKTGYDRSTINTINSTLTANWDLSSITKGLSVNGSLAYDVLSRFRKNWHKNWQYYSYDEVTELYDLIFDTSHLKNKVPMPLKWRFGGYLYDVCM